MSRTWPAAAAAIGTLWTLAGCGGGGGASWNLPLGDTTSPTVVSVSPSDGDSGIGSRDTLSLKFSEALDCAAIAVDAITVSEDAAAVVGTTTCSGDTLVFTTAGPLPTRATLTAMVGTSVRDTAGNALKQVFEWQFSVAPWTVETGTAGDDLFFAAASDAAGHTYAVGASDDAFLGGTPAGIADAVVVKYDSVGSVLWSAMLGTSENDEAFAVAVDGSGNVYVGGITYGDLNGTPGNAGIDAFVAKFSSGGQQLWVRQLHSEGTDFLQSMTVDASGNILVAGYTGGSLFRPNAAGATELFIAKLDPAGTLAWGYQNGNGVLANATAIATDASGNVFGSGYAVGGLDGNTAAGRADIFVTKLDPAGTRQWTRQFGTSAIDVATAVALDSGGNIFVAGRTDAPTMDGQSNSGLRDAFVMKLDPSGQRQWTRLAGSTGDDFPAGVAVDASGDLVVVGYTHGAFAGFVNAGGTDGFAFRLDAQGSLAWTRQWGSTSDDIVTTPALDASGAVYAPGWTYGSLDGIPNAGASDAFVFKIDRAGKAR